MTDISHFIRPLPPVGEKISVPGIYPISIENHHAQPCDGPSFTSSGLRKIFVEGPLEYWITSPLNPRRIVMPESPDLILGRAVHHLALGEAGFYERFAVMPPEVAEAEGTGSRTLKKKWTEEQTRAGRAILKPADLEAIKGMAGVLPWQTNGVVDGVPQRALEDSGLANNALVQAGILSGLIEHSIAFRDPETGLWLLSRPDAIPITGTDAGDLKTTPSVANLALMRTIDDFRYDIQAALIRMAMKVVMGIEMHLFALVFVEKKPPHAVAVRVLTRESLDEGEQDLRTALRIAKRCLDTGRWPGPEGRQHDATFIGRAPFAVDRSKVRRAYLEKEFKI